MLKKLFIVNNEPRHWFKVILWWEFRRLLYNFLLIIYGIIGLTILSFIIKDLLSFFSPPIFFLMWTALFIILANICYTSGWIFQLVTTNSSNKFINKIKPKLFIYGLIFSFFVTLTPCFFAGAYTVISGERIKSAYADFLTDEPKLADIMGNYKLSDKTKKQLNISDSIANHTIIQFNSDSTFEFKYFPHHEFAKSFGDYEFINAKGKWRTEFDQGSWVLPMEFDTVCNAKTGQQKGGHNDFNSFHLNGDKPPYEIYIIVGDPDSWEGITLTKK